MFFSLATKNNPTLIPQEGSCVVRIRLEKEEEIELGGARRLQEPTLAGRDDHMQLGMRMVAWDI